MKNLKNQKGITLVALVVTIIVLLILAGVSLSLVAGGNGIINKGVRAVDETSIGAAKEQAELKLAEWVADYYEATYVNTPANTDSLLKYVSDKCTGDDAKVGDYTLTLTEEGAITVTGKSVNLSGTVTEKGKVTWTTTNVTGNTANIANGI